jgi:hypothetical protein
VKSRKFSAKVGITFFKFGTFSLQKFVQYGYTISKCIRGRRRQHGIGFQTMQDIGTLEVQQCICVSDELSVSMVTPVEGVW